MGDILFLGHRLPFPPDRGDKIRSHHILKRLADIAPVHVATFADTPGDWQHEQELADLAKSYCLVDRDRPVWRAALAALTSGRPVSLAAFEHPSIAAYIRDLLEQGGISAIYVFSGQMGQYIPVDFTGRLVVDLVDVDSAKFDAYAAKAGFPMSMMYAREERRLKAEEERLAHRAEHTLLVSEAEAELLRSRLVRVEGAAVSALRNGIDAESFDPAKVLPHPELASGDAPQIVFTGQMDYPPNISAVERFARRIMPTISKHYPEAHFHVVGRAPTRDVLSLEGVNNTRVWGEVPDVKPFLAGADIVTAPLEIARGVQNKVLEAMSMARPCLVTPGAATGIDAENDVHFAVEDGDAALAARALELLANPGAAQALGAAARQFVLEHQSWPAMLSDLRDLMGFDGEGAVRRDAA